LKFLEGVSNCDKYEDCARKCVENMKEGDDYYSDKTCKCQYWENKDGGYCCANDIDDNWDNTSCVGITKYSDAEKQNCEDRYGFPFSVKSLTAQDSM
jgi:hypothetical protein